MQVDVDTRLLAAYEAGRLPAHALVAQVRAMPHRRDEVSSSDWGDAVVGRGWSRAQHRVLMRRLGVVRVHRSPGRPVTYAPGGKFLRAVLVDGQDPVEAILAAVPGWGPHGEPSRARLSPLAARERARRERLRPKRDRGPMRPGVAALLDAHRRRRQAEVAEAGRAGRERAAYLADAAERAVREAEAKTRRNALRRDRYHERAEAARLRAREERARERLAELEGRTLRDVLQQAMALAERPVTSRTTGRLDERAVVGRARKVLLPWLLCREGFTLHEEDHGGYQSLVITPEVILGAHVDLVRLFEGKSITATQADLDALDEMARWINDDEALLPALDYVEPPPDPIWVPKMGDLREIRVAKAPIARRWRRAPDYLKRRDKAAFGFQDESPERVRWRVQTLIRECRRRGYSGDHVLLIFYLALRTRKVARWWAPPREFCAAPSYDSPIFTVALEGAGDMLRTLWVLNPRNATYIRGARPAILPHLGRRWFAELCPAQYHAMLHPDPVEQPRPRLPDMFVERASLFEGLRRCLDDCVAVLLEARGDPADVYMPKFHPHMWDRDGCRRRLRAHICYVKSADARLAAAGAMVADMAALPKVSALLREALAWILDEERERDVEQARYFFSGSFALFGAVRHGQYGWDFQFGICDWTEEIRYARPNARAWITPG